MIFETHAHYDDKRYDSDRDLVLTSLKDLGVGYVVNAGATMKSTLAGIKLAEKHDFMYAAVGVHPHDVKDMTDEDIATLRGYCSHKKVVAVGEIGLDYHYEYSPKDSQRFWFKKQLVIANDVKLPIIIHSLEACQETMDIIKKSPVRNGVIHCFSGSLETAKEYVALGFYIGVGGVITFQSSKKLKEVVKWLPIERLLLETDAPYLAPEPHRGQRNNSAYLTFVAAEIARIKGISQQEVIDVTEQNAKALFSKVKA